MGEGRRERQEHTNTYTYILCIYTSLYSYRIAGIAKGFYQFTGQIEEMDRVIWTGKCINEKVRRAYRRRERKWKEGRREGAKMEGKDVDRRKEGRNGENKKLHLFLGL